MVYMAYVKHGFQDGQVLTGAQMDDIDSAVYDLSNKMDTVTNVSCTDDGEGHITVSVVPVSNAGT